jgi:hypothetical protein
MPNAMAKELSIPFLKNNNNRIPWMLYAMRHPLNFEKNRGESWEIGECEFKQHTCNVQRI